MRITVFLPAEALKNIANAEGLHLDPLKHRWVRDLPFHQQAHVVGEAIKRSFSPDLLKQPYRGKVENEGAHPCTGHCYVASEAFYHMMGGKDAGLKPMSIQHEGGPHWWVQSPHGHHDLTAEQFSTPVPHHAGVGKGFMSRNDADGRQLPSARAKTMMARAARHLDGGPSAFAEALKAEQLDLFGGPPTLVGPKPKKAAAAPGVPRAGLHAEKVHVGGAHPHEQTVWKAEAKPVVAPAAPEQKPAAPRPAPAHHADIEHAEVVASIADLISGNGLSKIAPDDESKVKQRLVGMGLGRTCGRCLGSGQYSSNQIHGTMCYGCNGHGDVPPALTRDLIGEVQQAVAGGAIERYQAKLKARKSPMQEDDHGSMGKEVQERNASVETRHVLAEWDLTDGGVRQVVSKFSRYGDGSPVGPAGYYIRDKSKGDTGDGLYLSRRSSPSFGAAVRDAARAGVLRGDRGGGGVVGSVRSIRPDTLQHHHMGRADRAYNDGKPAIRRAHENAAELHKRGDGRAHEASAAAHAAEEALKAAQLGLFGGEEEIVPKGRRGKTAPATPAPAASHEGLHQESRQVGGTHPHQQKFWVVNEQAAHAEAAHLTEADRKEAPGLGLSTHYSFEHIPLEHVEAPTPWSEAKTAAVREKLHQGHEVQPVRADFRDGKFHIGDGIHRVGVSREAGHATIPAIVSRSREIPKQAPEIDPRTPEDRAAIRKAVMMMQARSMSLAAWGSNTGVSPRGFTTFYVPDGPRLPYQLSKPGVPDGAGPGRYVIFGPEDADIEDVREVSSSMGAHARVVVAFNNRGSTVIHHGPASASPLAQ